MNSVMLHEYNQDDGPSQIESPDTIDHSYNTMAMKNDGNVRDSMLSQRRRKKNKRNASLIDSVAGMEPSSKGFACCAPSRPKQQGEK
mgnify:FL=1